MFVVDTRLRWAMGKRLPPDILDFFRKQGAKGGKIGGKKCLTTMTPEERRERAIKAVRAREAKRKKEKQ